MSIVTIIMMHKMHALQPFNGSAAHTLTKLYLTQKMSR